eukprot:CAMPEP_0201577096 /NCGR_PEP_ID=MMETSP0190_2-20130828/23310_1 /ASSEMBLY_ACC=CAM_ASM_000263 /TAXON_ID=37353 /ORGANISM="Rosalina sp." /LENGTH=715 /DNA_ID=CAMNT_0048008757 /DNA_START=120 /DNA_END=2264 /DNA_ORIENTATION=-
MSNKKDIQEMLVSMGFKPNYITRAFKVYEKNYGHSYNVEVITEIIVRLQNKDKAKQKSKGSDKDKSPQPPPKDKDKKDNKSNKGKSNKDRDNNNKKDKPSKSSPSKPSKSRDSPSKSKPKNVKKEAQQQQVNISAGTGSKSSSNNKRASGKQNNGMNTEPPPKAFASHTQYQSNDYNNNNLPNMSGMVKSQSGGRKKKPMKPPPANPLPNKPSASSHSHAPSYGNSNSNPSHNNNNNQVSPPKIHAKSQTVMSQSFKPQRQSPVPPPRGGLFNKGDTVVYQGQDAEIMRIVNQNQIEITYPKHNFIMQRHKAVVRPQDIQRKKAGPPPSGQFGQNNNNGSHGGSPQRHQYSQSSSSYPYQNGGNGNNQRSNPMNPLSNNQVNISMNNNNSHNKNNGNSNNSPPRNNKNITPTPSKTKKDTTQNGSTPQKTKGTTTATSTSSSIPSFESHMQLQDAFKLKVHDKIDHRDQVGRFVYATVSEKQGTNLKIHYDGWSRKWDTWSDFQKEIHRFAKAGSISKRPAHRFKQLKKGDYVDINPTQRHPGWKCGEIRRLDQKSGQVQVVYESADKNYLYWAHLDNKFEIAEFTSKSGTVHATQVDMLQKQQPNQGGAGQQQQQGGQQYDMNNKSMQGRPNAAMQQGGQQQQYPAQGGNGNFNQQQQYNQQQQQQQQAGYNMMMAAAQQEPMDEMEAFERIRAKRFPRYPNERIDNPYGIGDW